VFAYDGQLKAALKGKRSRIADVVATMRAIDQLTTDGDGLKWFNGLYLIVTETVDARAGAGSFADRPFMEALDVQFAELYFEALAHFLDGKPLPGCWRVLFDERAERRLTRIQCALAGMNAHINHDLAFAVVATCRTRSIAPVENSPQHRDFTALDATLEGLIDAAKKGLQLRLLGDELPDLGFVEKTIAGWSMSAARENAWNNAEILWSLRAAPALGERFGHGLDGVASVIGKALLIPVP